MNLLLLLALSACSTPIPIPEPPPPSPSKAPAAEAHFHGEEAHAHTAPHGGEVKTMANIHVEALFAAAGVLVYVADIDGKALDPTPFAGTALIQGPNGVTKADLTPMGEHLHAIAELEAGKPASVVVTLPVNGRMESAQFSVEAVGLAEHDHTSLHGGAVSMWGDVHVEYVAQDDELRFYISDARRGAVTAGVSGSAKDGDTVVPLVFDAGTGALSEKSSGAGTRPVMLDAKVGESTFSLLFNPRK